jgi:hypothetical protein
VYILKSLATLQEEWAEKQAAEGNGSTTLATTRRNFMLSAATLGTGLFVSSRVAAAPDAPANAAAAEALAYPERVMLSCSEDPAHVQRLTWRAAGALASPQAQIAPLSASPVFEDAVQTVAAVAKNPFKSMGGGDACPYAATFSGLQPETGYCYRVGDGATWSEWNIFKTASDKPAPFRFIYVGDVQNDIRAMCSRTMRMALRHAPDARFIVYAGDLVTDGYSDMLWDEFAFANDVISAMIPALPTPGNHDTHHETAKMPPYPFNADTAYHGHFALPENGPADAPTLNQEVYYVDYQGVRMISLNSNALEDEVPQAIRDAQLAWLEGVLRDNPNRWTMVTHHHPIYSTSKKRDNEWLRNQLRPLYDTYRVDLVLQGHDHTYGRTHKVAGDEIVGNDAPGTVYAVSVAGPKMYDSDPLFARLMPIYFGQKQLFQVIAIDGGRLQYDSYDVTGARVDGFELTKGDNGISTYSTTI